MISKRRRRGLVGVTSAMAIVLSVAAVAWACTHEIIGEEDHAILCGVMYHDHCEGEAAGPGEYSYNLFGTYYSIPAPALNTPFKVYQAPAPSTNCVANSNVRGSITFKVAVDRVWPGAAYTGSAVFKPTGGLGIYEYCADPNPAEIAGLVAMV
jgi:hypothetical protein